MTRLLFNEKRVGASISARVAAPHIALQLYLEGHRRLFQSVLLKLFALLPGGQSYIFIIPEPFATLFSLVPYFYLSYE